MISTHDRGFDIVLVTAEPYEDHPLSPAGVIARVLDAQGYRVGIVEFPRGRDDIARLGVPALFFAVTSGSIDSMLNNYTPLKRPRIEDEHSRTVSMPDRAVIVICNWIKQFDRSIPIVLGGIEASLRRFAHYDYWSNQIRRSILLDARADILVYGNGEKQILTIAERLAQGKSLAGIAGTCVRSRELPVESAALNPAGGLPEGSVLTGTGDILVRSRDAPGGFEILDSCEAVKEDRLAFCRMTTALSNRKNLAQASNGGYVLQYAYPDYTPDDLDRVYSLPFRRDLRAGSLLELARFSVVTHRGCLGRCHFCSIALHQGDRIISRSEASILGEIERLTRHPQFKGYVDDLGGPSANMYGMDCARGCDRDSGCLGCRALDRSHSRLVQLMRAARAVPGVKKVFVRSGIRYDLAIESREYIEELSRHHVSGTLKIAPEHFSPRVLELMNKDNARFADFVDLFNRLNRETGQTLRYYLMIGHPGDDRVQVAALAREAARAGNIEQFQIFTPTPMSVSSCMYWTGLNPFTLEPIQVVKDFRGKKELKQIMLGAVEQAHRKPQPTRRRDDDAGRRPGGPKARK